MEKQLLCKAHVTAFNDGLASDLDDCVVVLDQHTVTKRYSSTVLTLLKRIIEILLLTMR